MLHFVCGSNNDIYVAATLTTAAEFLRHDNLSAALAVADPDDGLLILAEGYPSNLTEITTDDWQAIAALHLPTYIEFPATYPPPHEPPAGVNVTEYERVVVGESPSVISGSPRPLTILSNHKHVSYTVLDLDSGNIPTTATDELLLARVAGYDTAIFGLPDSSVPLLTTRVMDEHHPPLLVATSKLSGCVTGRFSPTSDWIDIWRGILEFVGAGGDLLLDDSFGWKPTVNASFGPEVALPSDAEMSTVMRGVEWYKASMLMPDYARLQELHQAGSDPQPCPAPGTKIGNGQVGILEGFTTDVGLDGRQTQGAALRNDCISETSMPFALRAALLGNTTPESGDARTATNLLNFAWFQSGLRQIWDAPPGQEDIFGLLAWETGGDAYHMFYKDDSARSILAGLATASLLNTDRFTAAIVPAVLANLRITDANGFGPASVKFDDILQNGWRSYYDSNATTVDPSYYSPHYQSYIWAVYLWGYRISGFEPLLERARSALGIMMEGYPSKWIPTSNGITMQRARMLLPLSWLVRVDDTAQHREWLDTVAQGLLARQANCGAFREEVTAAGWAAETKLPTNDDYGTFESPLNQENADPVADMLYTQNFALLGLHEAAAATGDGGFVAAEAKLADFLVRVQANSEQHPELDGTFFRAFDFDKWEVWGSDADLGWGVWSTETGWSQSWIIGTLGMRQLGTTLWDLSGAVDAAEEFAQWLPFFFPDE